MIAATLLDQRGGLGAPCWVLLPEGVKRLMRVPDRMRKSVVFLYCTHKGERKAAGTAFFAGYPIPDYPQKIIPVLMTAKHVIAEIQQKSDDAKVLIRVNTKTGRETWLSSTVDQWQSPDQTDEALDLAFVRWQPTKAQEADVIYWTLEGGVATQKVMEEEGIGVGDETFAVSLFRNHLGRDRNEPILRVGNIAAIPADPIQTKHFGRMRAILIESRSIGGHSGSPVFVHLGFTRWDEGQDDLVFMTGGGNPFFFLGLMHGHWDLPELDADDLLTDDFLGIDRERLNTGISAVVPAENIMEALRPYMEPVVEKARELLAKQDEAVPDDT